MSLPRIQEKEREAGLGQTRVLLTGSKKEFEDQTTSSCFCKNWTKTKICCVSCLSCIAVVLVVIGGLFLSVYLKPTLTGDAEKWEKILRGSKSSRSTKNVEISDTYELVSYSDNFKEYLSEVGVPSFVQNLIMGASETLEIEILEDGCRSKMESGLMNSEHSYKWNTHWNMTYGRGMGVMWNFCKRLEENVIFCESEEREKGWKISSKMIFYELGMINERVFKNTNIEAKKYYKRRGVEIELLPEMTTEEVDFFVDEDEEDEWDWSKK